MLATPLLILALGCDAPAPPTPSAVEATPSVPAPETPPDTPPEVHPSEVPQQLVGEIVGIKLQNINKAQGRYSYQVDLQVIPSSVEPARPYGETTDLVGVRIDRLPWSRLTKAEQAAIAPDGPKGLLEVQSYKQHKVGDTVEMQVRFTSAGLAHPL